MQLFGYASWNMAVRGSNAKVPRAATHPAAREHRRLPRVAASNSLWVTARLGKGKSTKVRLPGQAESPSVDSRAGKRRPPPVSERGPKCVAGYAMGDHGKTSACGQVSWGNEWPLRCNDVTCVCTQDESAAAAGHRLSRKVHRRRWGSQLPHGHHRRRCCPRPPTGRTAANRFSRP